ncbi:Oxidoreductase, zinc-binding dehydrogenase family (plasmid) [Sodalis praecaptivus]|uniref:Oxidoreductase, zinc-binding dehydrogenase family n=1 Tax=Sodalis praecaptivus TaxID=1239307 RepID=W0I381_9GAMM|nr:NAD(P)-dependent alcohol dehydrogenase [Sodalis praecaptivus]AHF79217.1 Oxidoreductase, zinc-binding dehydrogenase family [Sodalis praecaptivus]
MHTMKRWEMNDIGRAALSLNAAVPIPEPGPDEVLVKVMAVALNHRDKMVIESGRGLPLAFPFTPGSDLSGCIVKSGINVTHLAAGDDVISLFTPDWHDGLRPGNARELAYRTLGGFYPGVLAQYVVMNPAWLLPKPASLSHHAASTLPCAALTAWFALVERGHLQPGETVLLEGTGGVAMFGLRIAQLRGARVIVVTRTGKVQAVKQLGADTVIDRTTQDVVETVLRLTADKGVDHVLEIAGGEHLGQAAAMAAVGGKIYLIGALEGFAVSSPLEPLLFKDLTIHGIGTGHRRALEEMCAAFDANGVAPVIDTVYPLEALPAALDHLAKGPFGKIVISVGEEVVST